MMDDPDLWGAYTRLQRDLNDISSINNRTWALESALNALIDAPAADGSPADTERIIPSAERRERHRTRLRLIYADDLVPLYDGAERMEARATLSILRDRLRPNDWTLITSTAAGENYAGIARRSGATAASLRIRALRIRRRLIQLAA
jgi:hypothetical protein